MSTPRGQMVEAAYIVRSVVSDAVLRCCKVCKGTGTESCRRWTTYETDSPEEHADAWGTRACTACAKNREAALEALKRLESTAENAVMDSSPEPDSPTLRDALQRILLAHLTAAEMRQIARVALGDKREAVSREEIIEALKPFADFGRYIGEHPRLSLHNDLYSWDTGEGATIRQTDLKRAAELYTHLQSEARP